MEIDIKLDLRNITVHMIQPNQFYYHFKKDDSKGIEHGAYLILGIGLNTENRNQRYVITKPELNMNMNLNF